MTGLPAGNLLATSAGNLATRGSRVVQSHKSQSDFRCKNPLSTHLPRHQPLIGRKNGIWRILLDERVAGTLHHRAEAGSVPKSDVKLAAHLPRLVVARLQRHLREDEPIAPQSAFQRGEKGAWVGEVLEHVRARDQVDAAWRQQRRLEHALLDTRGERGAGVFPSEVGQPVHRNRRNLVVRLKARDVQGVDEIRVTTRRAEDASDQSFQEERARAAQLDDGQRSSLDLRHAQLRQEEGRLLADAMVKDRGAILALASVLCVQQSKLAAAEVRQVHHGACLHALVQLARAEHRRDLRRRRVFWAFEHAIEDRSRLRAKASPAAHLRRQHRLRCAAAVRVGHLQANVVGFDALQPATVLINLDSVRARR
eukprot:2637878-Prymnesium_polylepis.3